jgi:hypothetical protein
MKLRHEIEKPKILCTSCGTVGGEAPCVCGERFMLYAKAGETSTKKEKEAT